MALLPLALLIYSTPFCEEKPQESGGGLHGQQWAFGQSQTRNEAIWKDGVDGEQLTRKSQPENYSGRQPDTSGAISRALDAAEKKNMRGSLGMSMGEQSSAWKSAPGQKNNSPDESMYRSRQHVVRAFADVKAGDDLDISLGPELILKDDKKADESAQENQPDATLGIGMKFKYDF